jgi:hypothetical protein
MERCGANTKRGGVCNKPAGWGIPYQHGRCKLHAGASPTHVKAAQRRDAERAVELFGLPREVEPHQALLEEVYRAAGHGGRVTAGGGAYLRAPAGHEIGDRAGDLALRRPPNVRSGIDPNEPCLTARRSLSLWPHSAADDVEHLALSLAGQFAEPASSSPARHENSCLKAFVCPLRCCHSLVHL